MLEGVVRLDGFLESDTGSKREVSVTSSLMQLKPSIAQAATMWFSGRFPFDRSWNRMQTPPFLQEIAMFKKILVPTDGSNLANGAAKVAAQLAKSQGAQVVGVYVIDPFPFIGIGDASAVALQSYMSEARRAATQALDAVGKACAAEGVPFVGDTIERNLVHEGVVETAKAEACDLIVMGSHGRQGVKALLLGSVAHKVLVHAEVPVLTVKEAA
jgi:nucleotide-binding universal stress UspA family protein